METPGNDGNHDAAVSNSQTTPNTVNHIYLLPGSGQGQYNSWMEKIGPLLHMASGHISRKPVIDLLITAFAPERIFVKAFHLTPLAHSRSIKTRYPS